MGGLVVKKVRALSLPSREKEKETDTGGKALTIAYNDPARYGDIHSSTASILFMATPHRGSDHAALLGGIAEVANLPLAGTLTSRFAGKVRDDLIKDLEKDNPAVKKIAEGFGALNSGKDVTLYSFVEMKRTKPLSRRVSFYFCSLFLEIGVWLIR